MLTEVSRGLLSIARKYGNFCDGQTLLRRPRLPLNSGIAERFDEMSCAAQFAALRRKPRLLEIVGRSQIGRLRYGTPNLSEDKIAAQSLEELLTYKGTKDLFADLLQRYARHSGISGMQPKVLLKAHETAPSRIAHRGATHVVKTFNPREHPELAANEFFCMQAARHAGIPVPAVELSNNRRLLIIERFDLRSDGTYLGCEDFCVLNGVRPHGRYDGSYELLARRIGQFVSPQQQRAALEQLFLMLALSCAVENGDAHLKNFAVVYQHADATVSLAPAYDMVSTTAYVPRDVLALTLGGQKNFRADAAWSPLGANPVG